MAVSTDSVVKSLRALLPELHEQFGVSRLWLFGSVARGTADEDSDVDVLVEFDRPGMTLLRFIELEQFLADRLGVSVDLVTRPAIKPSMRDDVLGEAVAV